MHQPRPPQLDSSFQPYNITRPAPVLMWYYFLVSLLAGPFFVLALLPLYFKYITLRYHFDDKGVSMSWGILWRREMLLTYRRIQDIHLTRNIVQRWLGLATVSVQTASGSASAEMAIGGHPGGRAAARFPLCPDARRTGHWRRRRGRRTRHAAAAGGRRRSARAAARDSRRAGRGWPSSGRPAHERARANKPAAGSTAACGACWSAGSACRTEPPTLPVRAGRDAGGLPARRRVSCGC